MKVELIPVVEVDTRIEAVAFASATPFSPGLPFYRTTDLTPSAVLALTKAHLQSYFAGTSTLEEQLSLYGGYVLRIDGQNALFPQCCGQLADIIYWKHVAKCGTDAYYEGHPAPVATFTPDEVILHCHNEHEAFYPNTAPEIRLNRQALAAAYDKAVQELGILAAPITQVGKELGLPVEDLAQMLIFHNPEMPDERP
ncbi:hypothetical protein LGH70_15360 [Hymenobacter sp. BT635]|uniref:Uncharacterized protein n=1 Tax=Hymenobacter nitidus TaxID=2880929 RepID=A0ABS8AEY3_9BACT|nr:hypothetical protein [Hymenobacter nitidus]MCB2378978.1 hypothetical protein [Hymenobacter nitidus]